MMEKEKVRVANVHGLPDDGAIRGEKVVNFSHMKKLSIPF